MYILRHTYVSQIRKRMTLFDKKEIYKFKIYPDNCENEGNSHQKIIKLGREYSRHSINVSEWVILCKGLFSYYSI